MNRIFYCLYFLMITQVGQAQENDNLLIKKDDSSYLKIGDIVPDILLWNVYHTNQSEKLYSHKAKLTILDFWSTYCGPCIRSFPKMDSLQKKFEGQLEVLLVNINGDTAQATKVKKTLQHYEALWKHKLDLHAVYMDIPTTALFFYMVTVPHYIWLDENKKIIATTSSDEITEENIGTAIAGKPLQIAFKPASADQ